jgi:hypothetical protein
MAGVVYVCSSDLSRNGFFEAVQLRRVAQYKMKRASDHTGMSRVQLVLALPRGFVLGLGGRNGLRHRADPQPEGESARADVCQMFPGFLANLP